MLALQITERICTEKYDNPKDRARIQYAIAVLISEGFKLIVLFTIFTILNCEKYFFFSLAIVTTVRTFSGGLHMNSALTCLLLTIPIFIFTSYLAPTFPLLNNVFYIGIAAFSFVIVFLKAPKSNAEKPIRNVEKRKQFKKIALFFTLVWCVLCILIKNPAYINCGFFTLLVQNLQLLPKGSL
jgi:accessory gene regulator B